MCLSSNKLTSPLFYGHPNLSTVTNRIIIEGTLKNDLNIGFEIV